MKPPMPPPLGYCKICRKKLTDEEVELCSRCKHAEQAGPMEEQIEKDPRCVHRGSRPSH